MAQEQPAKPCHSTDHFKTIYFSAGSLSKKVERCCRKNGIRRNPRRKISDLLQGTALHLLMSSMALQRNPPVLQIPGEQNAVCRGDSGHPKWGSKERNVLNHPLVRNNVCTHRPNVRERWGADNVKKNERLRTKTSRKNTNLWFPYTVSQLLSLIFKDITPPCHWDGVNCSYQEVKQDLMGRICSDFNELRTRDFQPRQIWEGTD